MNRLTKLLGILALLFALGCNSKPELPPPNVVWLVSEDNSKHYLNLYEEGGATMPNIEALAQKGVVFNFAFSNAPVCSVARSTLISGSFAPRIGAQYHRRMKKAPMPNGLEMFPAYLKAEGYYTSNNSKEDYNLVKSDSVWDDSSKKATYRDRSVGQPFFHVQNYGITHEGKLHFSQKEMEDKATVASKDDMKPFSYHPDTETSRYTYATYHDLHRTLDNQVGNFLDQLEEEGLLENTIIFYYGDHGGVLPRSKGYAYESGLHVPLVVYVPERYQHLTSLSPGTRTDAFVQFIDFGPTVLNLAGVKVPEAMDGKPFLGANVSSEDLESRDISYGYADRFDEKYDLVRTVRKANFKYIRNYQPFNIDGLYNFYRYKMLQYQEWEALYKADKLNVTQKQFFEARQPEQLFDIETDPHEVRNLADDPAHASTLKELRKMNQDHLKNLADLSFFPEPYFLEEGLSDPVKFGQMHSGQIADLIDVADLSLLNFDQAKPKLEVALLDEDPWVRYWGLIACTTFGDKAHSLFAVGQQLAEADPEPLVRLRAVECLLLNDQPTEDAWLEEIITAASSEAEANLMLNSLALIKSVKPKIEVPFSPNWLEEEWIANERAVARKRVDFLSE